MPEHYLGAQNEYVAAAWFLGQHRQVYWPSSQHGGVDFVIQESAPVRLHRVQVKTATWNRSSGPHHYLQCRTRLTNKYQDVAPADLCDLFVVVDVPDNRIWVIPSEAIDSSNLSLEGTNPKYKRPRWDKYRHVLFARPKANQSETK